MEGEKNGDCAMRQWWMWAWCLAVVMLAGGFGCGDDDDDQAADDDQTADDDADDDDAADDDAAGWWDTLSPSGLAVGEIMGIATQMYDGPDENEERSFEIEKLVEAGLRRVRASIDWGDVEPEQDQFTFEYSDPFVDLIVDSGLQFDGRLCYGVSWAAPDDNDSAIKPEDFGDYAGHVAEHFCGRIGSYEVWNEENHPRFWQPEPDPVAFGNIMKATYVAVHEACPEAKVLIGGLSCLEPGLFDTGLYYFLHQLYEAHPDIGNYFDALAVHPYSFLQTSTPEWEWYWGEKLFWPDMVGQLDVVRDYLTEMGAADKPLWLTEWGWPSLIVKERGQANYYARGALLMIAAGVEALDWYTFYDREGGSFPPTEDYFGLFTWPGAEEGPQEKPVYRVAKALSQQLGSSRFAGDMSAAFGLPTDVFALAFVDQESGWITLAAWDGRYYGSAKLAGPCPAGATGYEIVDEEGVLLAQRECAPGFQATLVNEVKYLRFLNE